MGTAAQWLLLAMCTAILLAAVTNQITQDVAPIPLLWVLPLGLYLLSFVVSFSIKAATTRLSIPLLGFATLAMIYALAQGNALNIPLQIGIYATALFLGCLACHGELTRLQPEPKLLTAYYLIIALGSVLGTVVVSLVAPLVFNYYWEFHLGFLLCWVVLIGVLYFDQKSILHKQKKGMALYASAYPAGDFTVFHRAVYPDFSKDNDYSQSEFLRYFTFTGTIKPRWMGSLLCPVAWDNNSRTAI